MSDSVNNAMQDVANSLDREANRVKGLGDKQALQGHTPGPWETSFSGRFVESASDPDHIVAEVYSQNPEANARLIAVAPEMLAELREFYSERGPRNERGNVLPASKYAGMTTELIDETWDFEARHRMHRIAKIIAKAEGR